MRDVARILYGPVERPVELLAYLLPYHLLLPQLVPALEQQEHVGQLGLAEQLQALVQHE